MTSTRHSADLRERLQLAMGSAYEIGEEVGRGGMSRVFAARDVTLNRDVVVKTLPPELAGEISVERFKREIHFAASLQHPHIVPVHAAGDVDGLPYYIMPRVVGEALRNRLNRLQRLATGEVLAIIRDVARALAYAHRRGLVHRDIKPENILLAEGGVAVVTDFGIAKAIAAARRDDLPSGATNGSKGTGLTAAGSYLGTPHYAAPEQASADPTTDHRADLYALGVVAYELLSGTTPFANRGPLHPLAAQLSETPRSVSDLRLDVPPAVGRLVMQCLEAEPAARPQSADAVVRVIEASMGAASVAPVGDEPGAIRKAFAWYSVAFLVAAGVAWVAMTTLGLPDWVLPGTIILMALGLPIVTVAALARQAAFQSSLERFAEVSRVGWLFTPGPVTLRVAQALTWRRVLIGGTASLGGFGVLVAGFMATRAAGIGPAATLLTSGQVAPHQSILLTDFASPAQDSTAARMAFEAVSMGLRESNVVQVVPPSAVVEGLRRMRRDPTAPLTLDAARELAAREGIGLIVTGEIARSGETLVVTARLVAADSGTVLATRQERAIPETDLLDAADRLTRSLRSKIGESLRRVRATPPLAEGTTASFEALSLYTLALRADEVEGDRRKAAEFLERALELDSTFASAWRKYSVVVPQPAASVAGAAAFRHRFNATDTERLAIEAGYYWSGGGYDRPRSIAAWEALALRTGRPNNNHAWSLLPLRQFARAESLYRVLFERSPGASFAPHNGIIWALMNQGKYAAADSVGRIMRARFPNHPGARMSAIQLKCGLRQFTVCQAGLDSIVQGNPRSSAAVRNLSEVALIRGQLARWEQLEEELLRLQAPVPVSYCCPIRIATTTDSAAAPWLVQRIMRSAWVDLVMRDSPASALARLDSLPRPVLGHGARLYALAGRRDTARQIIAALDLLVPVPDSAPNSPAINRYLGLVGQAGWGLKQAKAAVSLAEGRTREAIDLYRSSDIHPADGMPVYVCASCIHLDLADAFDRAGQVDSAIVHYERFITTPLYNPGETGPWSSRLNMNWWNLVNEAWISERLGRLYEAKGNHVKATEHFTRFVQLWKDADPELQPRVAAARARIARLKAS